MSMPPESAKSLEEWDNTARGDRGGGGEKGREEGREEGSTFIS
jgi:hypothetical protein